MSPRSLPPVEVRVEDDRTGMDPVTLRRAIVDHLNYTQLRSERSAHRWDWNVALSHMVRDRLVQRWIKTEDAYTKADAKRVYYLSAEFLTGRLLANNLISVGLYDAVARVCRDLGIELADLLEEEPDPGLGNGGLGRLAACFLDSMATLGIAGVGYGIRYEFGIFKQEIKGGRQIEHPDEWLK
ncbi:MAG: glycogen/starch/alpha-glucan phosphorylase, partial [Polyangiales bacterium]